MNNSVVKNQLVTIIFTVMLCSALVLCWGCGCGSDDTSQEDTGLYPSSTLSLSTFTEVAGENVDGVKETEKAWIYTYQVSDPQTGAAAYNLYKDYLEANFAYSMIDSTVAEDGGYVAVYHDGNNHTVKYKERIDEDGAYIISVAFPK